MIISMEHRSKITEEKVLLKKSWQILNGKLNIKTMLGLDIKILNIKIIDGIKANVACSKIINIILNVLCGIVSFFTWLIYMGKKKKILFNSDIYVKVQISCEFLTC